MNRLACFLFILRSIAPAQQDTIHLVKTNRQLLQLQQLTVQRHSDSLRRHSLAKQVAALPGDSNLKKIDLEKQLRALRKRDSVTLAQQREKVDSLRRFLKGFPVVPFRDTLFRIYARQGSFTAKERAEAVSARVRKFADLIGFKADSLKIATSENTTDLVYGDQLLISVSAQDALWQKTSPKIWADTLRSRIIGALNAHREETRWQTLLKESSFALLVVVIAGLLVSFINKLYRKTAKLDLQSRSWLRKGLRIRNYTLLAADRLGAILRSTLNTVRWILLMLTIYTGLTAIFRIFPFTRDLSGQLAGYITDPLKKIGEGLWNYIPNLFTILVLVIIFRLLLRALHYLKMEIERGVLVIPGFYVDWANPTYQIIRILALAFLLIVIFPYLPGSDSAVFRGVSVFMGVLFTFGSAGALGNVVAGLVMTYMRAFKVGDRVAIGDSTGDIVEKTLLVTRIRTIQNEIISIPNSTVMSNHTINYSSEATAKGLILHTSVTIGYDAPWRQVHQLLIDAALSTPLIEQQPAPYVLQTSLDDYYVSYRINAFTKAPGKQAQIYSDLHANIQDKFNEANVEIMSPHYNALRDGNATTVPKDFLPRDYKSQAFNIIQKKDK